MAPWWRAAACSTLAVATLATACSASTGDDGGDAPDPGAAVPTTATATSTAMPAGGGAGAPAGGGAGAPASPPAPPAPTAAVGERVLAAGYELVVHDVTAPAPVPAGGANPGPGRMLMTVDVEIVNRTASARDATYLRVEVVDAAGGRYAPSPAGDRPPTGWIAADVPERGVQLYEVPIDATGLVLALSPDLVTGIAATVRLR